MELHLDLVGGLAGDMFIAAMLDAYPQHEATVISAIQEVSQRPSVTCSLLSHRDQVLQGKRFVVELDKKDTPRVPFAPSSAQHDHVQWSTIRSRLARSALPEGVKSGAIKIFALLAQAEAFVHGCDTDSVAFHEVGAWDSIADIVGAAAIIDAVGATKWTSSAVPLGSGRVRTEHGILAVPAPATTQLLLGMDIIDDGIDGERVTPTGAAILKHLCSPKHSTVHTHCSVRILKCTGTGFGTRKLSGISNHARVLCFEPTDDEAEVQRQMHALEFEVDDQSGEDLAAGLERLRAHPGILDVTQCPVFGKKSRLMVHVSLLARYSHLSDVITACFRETTTIGLRHHQVSGIGLKRRSRTVDIDGFKLRVKIVDRPGGPTAKTESDDVLKHEEHRTRASLRLRAQVQALYEDEQALNA